MPDFAVFARLSEMMPADQFTLTHGITDTADLRFQSRELAAGRRVIIYTGYAFHCCQRLRYSCNSCSEASPVIFP